MAPVVVTRTDPFPCIEDLRIRAAMDKLGAICFPWEEEEGR